MKKFLVMVLAFLLFCPESLLAYSEANAESAHYAEVAFDGLPASGHWGQSPVSVRRGESSESARAGIETRDASILWKIMANGIIISEKNDAMNCQKRMLPVSQYEP